MSNSNSILNTLEAVCEVVASASRYISDEFRQLGLIPVEKKGSNDLVSYVDRETEKLIVRELRKIRPEASFETEEGTSGTAGSNTYDHVYWTVDPLDGTTNFLHGFPVFSISVALVSEGVPILGVVRDVMGERTYAASAGNGAWSDETQLHVSETREFSDGLFAVEHSYEWDDRAIRGARAATVLQSTTHGVRTIGSAALGIAAVAEGAIDGFYAYCLKPWDVTAGIVLVTEAGGTVTDFLGHPCVPFNGQIAATNGHMHNKFLKTITE
ncbi:MAG: inositol monophosphatase family protein [Alkalispirochaeta sp.]